MYLVTACGVVTYGWPHVFGAEQKEEQISPNGACKFIMKEVDGE